MDVGMEWLFRILRGLSGVIVRYLYREVLLLS